MDEWTSNKRYSWGGYPLGPVANSLQDRQFLWNDGVRSQSNWNDFLPQQPFANAQMQVPSECAFKPLGCLVPPLATCREPSPKRS
jgi:hypothetical protein